MIRWLLVIVYTLSIYAAIPFARDWQSYLRNRLDSNFGLFINFSLISAGLLPLWWVARRVSLARSVAFIGIIFLAFAFVMQMELPEERIHLLQYGFLGYICASAVFLNLKGIGGFASVAAIGLVIGLGDELIQGVFPSRVFDWRDVAFNFAGVLLGSVIFQITK